VTFDQADFDIRCEWGEKGLSHLLPTSDVTIVVDVMSFSTCVSVAVGRGAIVYPYRYKDDSAAIFAQSVGAEAAGARGKARYSLSPASLLLLEEGGRLVLPSPNGAALSLATGETPTFAGCLRNARAVARSAQRIGRKIAVIPAGERWKEDSSLRPAFEDLIGAGAVISHLKGSLSVEARMAMQAFLNVRQDLLPSLQACSSGRELREMGFEEDIPLIARLDAEEYAPILRNGAYSRM